MGEYFEHLRCATLMLMFKQTFSDIKPSATAGPSIAPPANLKQLDRPSNNKSQTFSPVFEPAITKSQSIFGSAQTSTQPAYDTTQAKANESSLRTPGLTKPPFKYSRKDARQSSSLVGQYALASMVVDLTKDVKIQPFLPIEI